MSVDFCVSACMHAELGDQDQRREVQRCAGVVGDGVGGEARLQREQAMQ